MTQVTLLLKAFDDTWSHEGESLRPLLEGVTDHEAAWQHESYVDAQDAKGLTQPGTIRWHVGHLEQCSRRYVQILRTRPVAENPVIPAPALTTLSDMVHRFETVRHELRAEIARIEDADLTAPCRAAMTFDEFVLMVIPHEAWHAGQIAVIRRLYRTRHDR